MFVNNIGSFLFGFYSAAIFTIFAAAKTEINPNKMQIPDNNFKLAASCDNPELPISNIGIIKGRAITPIIGAEFSRTDRLPQKAQMKFMAIVAREIKARKFRLIS